MYKTVINNHPLYLNLSTKQIYGSNDGQVKDKTFVFRNGRILILKQLLNYINQKPIVTGLN